MGVIFYKYKCSKDFLSLPIDGPYVSVSEMKYLIFSSKKYGDGRTKDFDLLISDANSHQQYEHDHTFILSNSYVSLRRIPALPPPPIVAAPKIPTIQPTAAEMEETPGIDFHDFGPGTAEICRNVTTKKLEENQKADGYGSNSKALLDHRKGRTPPQGYVCHRCKVAGHYIQHCPTNGDPSFDLMKRINPIVSENNSNSNSSSSSVSQNSNVPIELLCSLCNKVMADAALTECCCISFCDGCIKNHINVTKGVCICQSIINASHIFPNLTLRDIIIRYLSQSGNSTSASCVTTKDVASKSPQEISTNLERSNGKISLINEPEIKQQTKKRKVSLVVKTEVEQLKWKIPKVEIDMMPATVGIGLSC